MRHLMLHNDGRIDRIGEDASGGKVDLFDLIGDKKHPEGLIHGIFMRLRRMGLLMKPGATGTRKEISWADYRRSRALSTILIRIMRSN